MSTYVHRFIEFKKDGQWHLVEWQNPMQSKEKLSKFKAEQMGLDYDSFDKTVEITYNNSKAEYAIYDKHEPCVANNACTFRDNFLTQYNAYDVDWSSRGLPSDIDSKTRMWINSYKYEMDYTDKHTVYDGIFDAGYVTVAELYDEIRKLSHMLHSKIKEYADEKVRLEMKSMLIQTEEAKNILESEKEELEYLTEDFSEIQSCISALEGEATFAEFIVNNPHFMAGEDNIRIILFKTN